MPKSELNKLSASFVAGLKKYNGKPLPEGMKKRWPDGGGLWLEHDQASLHWRWHIRVPVSGTEQTYRTSYGLFPDVPLVEARKRRDAARKLCAAGIHPTEQKREERKEKEKRAMTYEIVAREWHGTHELNAKSKKLSLQQLERHIFPVIGDIPFTEVTRLQLAGALGAIAVQINERTGAPKIYSAHKIASYLAQIDEYGYNKGWIAQNRALRLTKSLPKLKDKEGYPAIVDPAGVARILRKITAFCAGESASPYMRLALRLFPYMAMRNSALVGARWTEIAFDKRLWTIQAEAMRTKFTDGERVFPLSNQAIEILRKLEQLRAGSEYIFPSSGKSGHITPEGLLAAHRDALGEDAERHLPHGWRKTFATLAREAGAPTVLTEASLAHAIGPALEVTYVKAKFLAARAVVMQWYADLLDALEAGQTPPKLPPMEDFASYE